MRRAGRAVYQDREEYLANIFRPKLPFTTLSTLPRSFLSADIGEPYQIVMGTTEYLKPILAPQPPPYPPLFHSTGVT